MPEQETLMRFEHDCESCIFLGTINLGMGDCHPTHDLYACYDTVVARYSSAGADYHSGIEFAGNIPAIAHAIRRALMRLTGTED